MSLGEELRKARMRAGVTQEELAYRADISRNYVSLLELDQKSPTVQLLLRICRALGVKASKIIGRVE
jgi:transcriptional regulator with XRE-family HTH domain